MRRRDIARFGYLIAAIAVLVVFLVYTNMQEQKVQQRREKALAPLIAPDVLDGCSYVAISQQNKDDVELLQKDARWHVRMPDRLFPALPEDVEDLVGYFDGIKPESVVSEDEAAFTRFGVDEESGVTVAFYAGEEESAPLAEFVMGDSGSDYYSIYARKLGDVKTYLIPENKSTLWNREAKLWRDTHPLRESREDFHSITIRTADETFTLALGDDGFWAFADDPDAPVNQEETVGLISRLTGLVGLNLVDDEESAHGLDSPEWEFELGIGERTVTLSASAESEDRRYLYNSELDQVYEISTAPLQGLKTARKDFIRKEEPADGAEEMEAVSATGSEKS
jgi:hypothetical protein